MKYEYKEVPFERPRKEDVHKRTSVKKKQNIHNPYGSTNCIRLEGIISAFFAR